MTNQQLQKVADDARHYQMQAEGLRRQAQGIDGALQETRGALEQAEKVGLVPGMVLVVSVI